MPKKSEKIRFTEQTHITARYDKKGNLISEYNERTLIVPASSLKAKRLKTVQWLKGLSDRLEISGVFANGMARIASNWKKPQNRVCRRPKVYFDTAKNELAFKQTFKTARRQLEVILTLFRKADGLGIDDEGKARLGDEFKSRYYAIAYSYPEEFTTLPKAYRSAYPMTPKILRSWYAALRGEPGWMLEKVTDAEIKALFDSKCARYEGTSKPAPEQA